MGIRLLQYQHELRQALKLSPVVVVEKSRRTGYSWGASWVAAEYAAKAKSEGGMNVYYMGYNLDMAREFIEYVGEAGKTLELGASAIGETLWQDAGDPDNQIKAFRVDFRHGRVTALPSRPRSLRGMQGLVILDEAAFHEDLDELLKAALALTIWGGKVLIISTHDGEDNAFNQLVQDCRAGRKPYTVLRCDFDRAISEGLYKRICERTGKVWSAEAEAAWREDIIKFYGDGADEELFCIPSRTGGSYLVRTVIEGCMDPTIPVLRWEPPAGDFVDWSDDQRHREMRDWLKGNLGPLLANLPQRQSWVGEDFGRVVDLTDIWPLMDAPGLTYRTPFLLELRDCPFTQQEQALFYVCHGLPMFSGAALDKGGNGAFLAERARQEFGPEIIEQVNFSENWNLENWPPAKAALEDRTAIIPKDENVLDDLRAVKVVKGVPKVPRDARTVDRKDSGKRHGDSAIAFALSYFAARKFDSAYTEWDFCTSGSSRASRIMRGF
ncbi:MAG: hypothetical protein AB7E51_18635 [Pseudodesulfovibrio sp.]|uniref:hypothetical protein n=1 Tax=Pseudodesulfovibrio sp. TaxID=2035812 RepID=UPI003D0DD4F9